MSDQRNLDGILDLLNKSGWKPRLIGTESFDLAAQGAICAADKETDSIKLGEVYMLSSYDLLGSTFAVTPCFELESEEDAEGILKMIDNISRVPTIRTPLEHEPLYAFAVQFCQNYVVVMDRLPCGHIKRVPVSYDDFLSSLKASHRYDA